MDKIRDNEYLEGIIDGKTSSFDSLFVIYYPRMLNFINSLIKNKDDAKDLAQDVFVKLWNNKNKLSEIDSVKAYLFQMAKYAVYDYFKDKKFEYEHIASSECIIVESEQITQEIEAKDLSLLIDIVVNKMPPQQKTIFIMSRKEGLSNEEISTKLNISKRTVEKHISNALICVKELVNNISLFFL